MLDLFNLKLKLLVSGRFALHLDQRLGGFSLCLLLRQLRGQVRVALCGLLQPCGRLRGRWGHVCMLAAVTPLACMLAVL
ncbi:hypothetical protein D9M72_582120 [compost metagenome]